MSALTLEEIKQKKDQLERELLKLVEAFENETMTHVSRVSTVWLHGGASTYGWTANVSVEIKI